MEPIIPLYACSRCRTIYQDEGEALKCFKKGIRALKIRRGSVFKLNFKCVMSEGDSRTQVHEGESYFVLSQRRDSLSVGHYVPFSGFCFSNTYTDNRLFDTLLSPLSLVEMTKPEFNEVNGYLRGIRDSRWGQIEEMFSVKKNQLCLGKIEVLPENARSRLEDMRRALDEAVARENYEAAEIYRDGISAIEEEIAFAQRQR